MQKRADRQALLTAFIECHKTLIRLLVFLFTYQLVYLYTRQLEYY